MSDFAPILTDITPGTWSWANVLTAVHDHFAATSALWNIELLAAGGSGDGFVVRSVSDPLFGICFRRNTLTSDSIRVGIQPGATGIISAVGNATTVPSGTNAQWSAESNWNAMTGGTPAKMWMVEFEDAFFVMIIRAGGDSWLNCLHAGRIYNPFFPAVEIPLGRDGLGILVNGPTFVNAAGYFFGNSATNTGRIRYSADKWYHPQQPTLTLTTATDSLATMGFVRPQPIPITTSISGVISFPVGVSRYMMFRGTAAPPLSRWDIDNTTEEAWITGGEVNFTTAVGALIPWRRSVTP